MIDLHIHSKYSGLNDTLEDILILAENTGVEVLSITDHDNVDVYYELKNIDIKKYYNGKIIYGVEINCVHNGIKIELLAYNFDLDKMKKWIDEIFGKEASINNLKKEVEYLYNKCIEKNIRIDKDTLIKYDPSKYFPTAYIYNEIIKYKENNTKIDFNIIKNEESFYRNVGSNIDFPLYMDFSISLKSAKEVSDKIREFGGKVFIAHIYGYVAINNNELLNSLAKEKILDGAETYYPSFTKEQINYLLDFCNKNNLFISGGTDFHGVTDTNKKIGLGYDNLNIPIKVIENWI